MFDQPQIQRQADEDVEGESDAEGEEFDQAGVRLRNGVAHGGRGHDVASAGAEDNKEQGVAGGHADGPGNEKSEGAADQRGDQTEDDQRGAGFF